MIKSPILHYSSSIFSHIELISAVLIEATAHYAAAHLLGLRKSRSFISASLQDSARQK
jgi:hypothetical protein